MTTEREVVPLYPGAAPGSESWNYPEVESSQNSWDDEVVTNVSRPTLTIVRPRAGSANGAGIVICPGGGFHGLSMGFEGYRVAEWLAARGVTCFILKYRLVRCTTPDPGLEMRAKPRDTFARDVAAVVPLAAADGLAAVAYVRAHSTEFALDPAKIGIIGFSAGGTVAISVAFGPGGPSRPDFVAPIYPQYDWAVKAGVPAAPMPMFIACATNDDVGLAPHSVRLYQDWAAAGLSAELHMFSTGGHGFGMRTRNVPSDHWIEAFGAWLAVERFLPAGE
jgi:acetyl esterase/lipase